MKKEKFDTFIKKVKALNSEAEEFDLSLIMVDKDKLKMVTEYFDEIEMNSKLSNSTWANLHNTTATKPDAGKSFIE